MNYVYDNETTIGKLHEIEDDVLLRGADGLYEEIREKVIIMMKNLEKIEDALEIRNVEERETLEDQE